MNTKKKLELKAGDVISRKNIKVTMKGTK